MILNLILLTGEPRPDQYFWYTIATVLVLVLVWIVQRYVSKTDKLMEKLVEGMNQLDKTAAIHDQRIQNLEKNSDEIAEKIITKLRAIQNDT